MQSHPVLWTSTVRLAVLVPAAGSSSVPHNPERARSLVIAQPLNGVSRRPPQCRFGVPPSPESNSPTQKPDLLRRQPPTGRAAVFLNVVNGGRLGNGNHTVLREA